MEQNSFRENVIFFLIYIGWKSLPAKAVILLRNRS